MRFILVPAGNLKTSSKAPSSPFAGSSGILSTGGIFLTILGGSSGMTSAGASCLG
jgi:hypothetical protein